MMLRQFSRSLVKTPIKNCVAARFCTKTAENSSPVNSYTEWDPLEEVLVGRPEGSVFSGPWGPPMAGCAPAAIHEFLKAEAGKKYPEELIKKASQEVEEFCRVLEIEGVNVRFNEI